MHNKPIACPAVWGKVAGWKEGGVAGVADGMVRPSRLAGRHPGGAFDLAVVSDMESKNKFEWGKNRIEN